jgi:protein-L-isoaspartate(D-aspartate) O-methyltransferase
MTDARMQPSSRIPPLAAWFGGFEDKLQSFLHPESKPEPSESEPRESEIEVARERMIHLLVERGIREPRVLAALRKVARHAFVPEHLQDEAYADRALPIAGGQTISQPYIVALMTVALDLAPESRVLEIGTGSGYQTAILCELAAHVTTIEVSPDLARAACERLARAGYTNVDCLTGDGYQGAPDRAPFDAILVTAAPDVVPSALIDQLAVGGRLCVPVGARPTDQVLLRIVKRSDGTTSSETLASVRFVPMIRTSVAPSSDH